MAYDAPDFFVYLKNMLFFLFQIGLFNILSLKIKAVRSTNKAYETLKCCVMFVDVVGPAFKASSTS